VNPTRRNAGGDSIETFPGTMKSLIALTAAPAICAAVFCGAASHLAAEDEPPARVPRSRHATPAAAPDPRDNVHVFLVNGMTLLPHYHGSMTPIRERLPKLGFRHTEIATQYYRHSLEDKVRKVHRTNPEARIVLVGYSIGGSVVHSMARTLGEEQIPIELVVYIDPRTIANSLDDRAQNVKRVVCVNSVDPLLRGQEVAGAEDVKTIDTAWHLDVAKEPRTFEILLRELEAVATGDGR
jgi:hypothetical protein